MAIYVTIIRGVDREIIVYHSVALGGGSLAYYVSYIMANKGPIRIYENGIDCPIVSIRRKRKYILFDEISGIYLNQSQDAKKKNVHKRQDILGMAFFLNGEHLVFSIPQTNKIVPILQELLKERWNEL